MEPKLTPELAFKRYEEVKIQIRELETEIEKLKPAVIAFVPEDKEVLGEKGYFYIQQKAKWTYTDETQRKESELKKLKKDEEARGDATASYTPILYYKDGRPEEKKAE